MGPHRAEIDQHLQYKQQAAMLLVFCQLRNASDQAAQGFNPDSFRQGQRLQHEQVPQTRFLLPEKAVVSPVIDGM